MKSDVVSIAALGAYTTSRQDWVTHNRVSEVTFIFFFILISSTCANRKHDHRYYVLSQAHCTPECISIFASRLSICTEDVAP